MGDEFVYNSDPFQPKAFRVKLQLKLQLSVLFQTTF